MYSQVLGSHTQRTPKQIQKNAEDSLLENVELYVIHIGVHWIIYMIE